jgi:hypothetical protein
MINEVNVVNNFWDSPLPLGVLHYSIEWNKI